MLSLDIFFCVAETNLMPALLRCTCFEGAYGRLSHLPATVACVVCMRVSVCVQISECVCECMFVCENG